MSAKLFWTILICAAAYLGADMVNRQAWQSIETALAPPPRAQNGVNRDPREAPTDLPEDHSVIVAGDIFNSRGRGAPLSTPKVEEAPVEIVPKAPLPLSVVGTVVGPPSFAIVEDVKTKQQGLYRTGDLLADVARLVQIRRNAIVVQRGGEIDTLEVAYAPQKQAPTSLRVPAEPAAASGVRKLGEGRYVVDRREVDGAVENLPQLLTQARMIPNFTAGKPDGFRIFAIQASSLYAKIGLQNGDILHRVNDIEVKDPQNVMQIFSQLKDQDRIAVDLVRGGQPQTLSYEIR